MLLFQMKTNLNKGNLVNYVLDNAYNDPASYRNIYKSNSLHLNVLTNKFVTKTTYYEKKEDHTEADQKNNFIDFKIPIYLQDISDFL